MLHFSALFVIIKTTKKTLTQTYKRRKKKGIKMTNSDYQEVLYLIIEYVQTKMLCVDERQRELLIELITRDTASLRVDNAERQQRGKEKGTNRDA